MSATPPENNALATMQYQPEAVKQVRLRRSRIVRSFRIGTFALALLLIVLFKCTTVFTSLKPHMNSDSAAGQWAMFRRDLQHTGTFNPQMMPSPPNVKWTYATNGIIHSSPVVVDGVVYVGSRDGRLYALDAADGRKLWDFHTGSWVESSPAVSDGVIYFGSNDGSLYALDARSGEKLWAFQTTYGVLSSPAIANGTIFFGADDYHVYALESETGKEKWRFKTGDRILSSPAIAGGILYIGSQDGFFYTLSAHNGQLLLKFKVYDAIVSSPVVHQDTVFVCNSRGRLYAIDRTARNWFLENKISNTWRVLYFYGDLPRPPPVSGYLWSLKLPGYSASSPMLVENRIVVGAGPSLFAVDLDTREIMWSFSTEELIIASPATNGRTIYAGSSDGRLYALDAVTGSQHWAFDAGSTITSSPAAVDGVLFFGAHDGKVYALY